MRNIHIVLVSIIILHTTRLCAQNLKKDDDKQSLIDSAYNHPIFKLNDEQFKNEHRHLRYSVLTGYREIINPLESEVNFKNVIDVEHGTSRTNMINLSIPDLLSFGYHQAGNRLILEVKDPKKYKYSSLLGPKLEWIKKNTYCFEYVMPCSTLRNKKIIVDELCHYFGITFKKEKRVVQTLVLVRTSSKDKIKTRGIEKGYYDEIGNFYNLPLDELSNLFDFLGFPPMVNETDYSGMVDLKLDIEKSSNILSVKRNLKKYDLDLKLENRELEMLVITENKN